MGESARRGLRFNLSAAQLKKRAAHKAARSFSPADENTYFFRLMSTPLRPRLTSTPFDAKARYTCTPF
jgi:hypothetical protein